MGDEYSNLENSGLFALNCDGPAVDSKTLIVLGAPRGGTSALAGALSELGIYMGRGAAPPVFESLALANAIESEQDEQVRKLVEGFNAEHAVWGFKRPGYTRFLEKYHAYYRSPVYLVIFRDPIATASRGLISGRLKTNFTKKVRRVLAVYRTVLDFVGHSDAPAVFISYEKLLQDPARVMGLLLELLGLEVDDASVARAVSFVEPSPSHYLEVSRADRVDGGCYHYSEHRIAGWASYVNKTMQLPATVVLYDGENELATVVAKQAVNTNEMPRPPREDCGFEFDLGELGVKPGGELRVRVKGDIRDFDIPPFQGKKSLKFFFRNRITQWRES